ncbi:non-heme iron oxygenase ferredoxin subunit [Streptomyces sp. B1866]|uniref:Rieske (2Fe-2S) protein n=1 Tax=Streptomyces sp. B1866 TaxID=3075431 RepID=UPI0028918EAB|nr:non-heme iron oxygenase ferredoxin subunit [Streptomyces sp. B1866]MDT3395870.1 non-heme iron oxygenase ferredoxin subunit [Streptomyces sp. B1866]
MRSDSDTVDSGTAGGDAAGAGVRVASLADLPPGELTSVEVDGVAVLLANVGGTVRAVRDQCTHEEAPLSEGDLEGDTVVCPWHFASFCLRTGEALEAPATEPVRTYEVRVVDGEVYVSRP